MAQDTKYKAELFIAKRKVGIEQAKVTQEDTELLELIMKKCNPNERQQKKLEITLRGKNCTPRYW